MGKSGDWKRQHRPLVKADRCGPTGKRRYATEGKARAALREAQQAAKDHERRREQRCYKCNACAGWHLTSTGYGTLSRSAPIARGTTKLAARNDRQHAARVKRGKAKHAAYKRSDVAKVVAERAQGRCEMALPRNPHVVARGDCFEWTLYPDKWTRCEAMESDGTLQDHHVSYHGYGGHEDPEKVIKACVPCHHLFESLRGKRIA